MELESEASLIGPVTCPHCGREFEAELTGTVYIEIDPEDMRMED